MSITAIGAVSGAAASVQIDPVRSIKGSGQEPKGSASAVAEQTARGAARDADGDHDGGHIDVYA